MTYMIVVSKLSLGVARQEVFRLKVENHGLIPIDLDMLRFMKPWCKLGYSVCVDPAGVDDNKAFTSYRSHDGQPFKKILFKGGGFAFDNTEIPWEQVGE